MADTPKVPPPGSTWPVWRAYLIRLALAVLGALLGSLGTYAVVAPAAVQTVPPTTGALTAPPQTELVLDYEGHPIDGPRAHAHGVAEVNGNGRRWPTDTVPYWVDYQSAAGIRPALSQDAVRAAFRQAADWWCEGLQLSMPEVADPRQALLLVRFGRVDGPLGTLAYQELSDGTRAPKNMMVDVQERWSASGPTAGSVSLPAVAAHEWGHGLGLHHSAPGSGHLMAPTYSASVPRPTRADYDRMVTELGYAARATPNPVPGDVLRVPIELKVSDAIDALQRLGYKVGK